ncbi:AP-4 complex subunit epsilon-1-like isoform X2 [Acropora muricata]
MRENLVRLIYCQMLGHDVSSGYVEAIKFAEQQSTLDKRVGYLAASLFLHEDHELIVLLINTLQKDLKSTNVMEVCCALTVVCKLINKDMMPALLPQVLQLLQSKRDIVRKKAVMALHSFYIKSPSSVPDLKEHAKKAIMDKDPGVMCASLQVFNELIKASPTECKDLVPAFVSLQKMIVEGKLAPEYDYHGVSSPWIQVKLLRMLGLLGADDQRASQKMYSVLGRTLTNLNTNSLISYAVAYECTRTITAIYPDKGLIGKAARCVGIFLVAKTNDIKYIGITTLTSLLQVGSGFVMESAYQRFVIDCLDDPDETLKRKTLDLLCHITNASNVETVCEKLLSFLKSTTDVDTYFRAELVDRITEVAERYAPDNSWYILTMNEIFELGGSLVRETVSHNLMRFLAEGTDEEDADNEIRRFAVVSYMDLLEKPVLPDILIRVICWVLGEYSYTASEYEPEVILEELITLLERKFEDPGTKAWVVSAIGKLMSQMGQPVGSMRDVLEKNASAVDVELRQRSLEIDKLSKNTIVMQSVLPVDGCCEDLEVDESLSFMDSFVSEALANGASPYKPMSERRVEEKIKETLDQGPTLNFTPYENPMKKPINPPTLQADKNPAVTEERAKSQEIPKDESKLKKRPKEKKLENPVSTEKLFTGKAMWGPGGYANDRARSGSVDSSNKSDSSSRSTGSEQAAVKTNSEVSSSSPVAHRDDVRKQHLAAQLFSGVTGEPRSASRRGHFGSNRLIKHSPKTNPRATGSPPIDGFHQVVHGLRSLSTEKADVNLLQDFDSDQGHAREIERTPSNEHALIPTLDVRSSLDNENSTTEESCDSDLSVSAPSSSNCGFGREKHLLDDEIGVKLHYQKLTGTPTASLSDDLVDFPHSQEALELCSDCNLRVTLQKVWKPGELVLVLYLTNQNQASASISDVISALEAPSNLIALFDSSAGNKFQNDNIGPLSWVRHKVALKYQSPALHMNFGGKISYRDPNRTLRHLFFNHTLSMKDILRPLVINTEEFGLKWTDASFEKRQKMFSSSRNCQEFSKRAEQELNIYTVEIIGGKVILAGTLMESGICLLHASCDGDSLELSIKSNNRLLNDAVLKHCVTVFR